MKSKEGNKKRKYIFVTGGVISGVGKGITAASIGAILKAKGYKVSIQKFDPYLNVDAGLLNPVEHGECFVTRDGAETDLDLGHYERFLDEEMTTESIYPSGKLFRSLIEKERAGGFHGKTVQLVPHLISAIHEAIERGGRDSDVHIVEIGGTVGDYEGLSYIEAIRTFANIVGRENCLYVSVVYVMWLAVSKEFKTKPAQNALKDLNGFGIVPDLVVVRMEKSGGRNIAEKIAKFAGISDDAVIMLPDARSVYDVPLQVAKSGVVKILNKFVGDDCEPDMSAWENLSKRVAKKYSRIRRVGLVAKYVDNDDTYMSVTEALKAAAFVENVGIETVWINAEKATEADFAGVDGILVPGGFGARGVDGKIAAADFALSHDKPYLGLCLGLQVAVIAAARRGGLKRAGSEEFDSETPENVVYIMPDQRGKESTGGTMRLGDYPAVLFDGSLTAKIYGKGVSGESESRERASSPSSRVSSLISSPSSKVSREYDSPEPCCTITERHRHRYEVNQDFLPEIEKGGVVVSGTSPDGKLVEFIEAPAHKFFVATQAHPEFKSRPTRPHPLFVEFIKSLKEDKS